MVSAVDLPFRDVVFNLLMTLFTNTKSKRAHTWMSPPESCHSPRLILDDVGMGTKGLVVRKEGCYVQAFEDEMGKSPIHNKFVCCCGLEIGLRKAKYFFEKIILKQVGKVLIGQLVDFLMSRWGENISRCGFFFFLFICFNPFLGIFCLCVDDMCMISRLTWRYTLTR